MRVGIIDLGSNTTRLLVFDVRDGHSRLVEGLKDETRLASGMMKDGRIDEDAIVRVLRAAGLFRDFCNALGVEKVTGVATAAIRDAANGREIIDRIRKGCSLDIRIISGEEEGELDYCGVTNTMDLADGYILDMGGASMELVRVKDIALYSVTVIPYGTITMSDKLSSKEGFGVLEKDIRKRLASAEKNDTLVGVGGTIRAIAKLDMKRKGYPLKLLHNYTMSAKDVDAILKLLKGKSRGEIIRMGVSDDRSDLVLPGVTALKIVMDALGTEELRISHTGIREGMLYRDILKIKGAPLDMSVSDMMNFYGVNVGHARNVESIALNLFDILRKRHGGGEEERKLLSVASLLHDVGLAVGYYGHGDNGCSIILSNGIYGLEHREILKCALIVKLHTDDGLKGYGRILSRKDRRDVMRLGVLLRLAESMDITESGLVKVVSGDVSDGALHLRVEGEKRSIWSYGIERNSDLFSRVYGLKIVVD
jgi:exopolyphosphatase/guanosine-5'-triphosphate,3'-diphosphate pyrophosphatase